WLAPWRTPGRAAVWGISSKSCWWESSPCVSLTQRPPRKSIAGRMSTAPRVTADSSIGTFVPRRAAEFNSAGGAKPRRSSGDEIEKSLSQGGEFVKQRQSCTLALFRVELGGKEIVLPNHGDEWGRIISKCSDKTGVSRNYMIGMHEIKVGAVGNILQNWSLTLYPNLIPSHVRYLE